MVGALVGEECNGLSTLCKVGPEKKSLVIKIISLVLLYCFILR